MKKLIGILLLLAAPMAAMASGHAHLDSANIDLNNKEALHNGAKYFVNYCMGCHSLQYERWERMANDLGLSKEQVMDNLVFTDAKFGDTMKNAMPAEDAAKWFGTAPPDLSLIVRSKKGGPDWLYTYLRSFYLDPSRPFGVNNHVFKDVGMPHVLWELQGLQKAKFRTEKDAEGNEHEVFEGFELVQPGIMSPEEYDAMVRDLTTFLAYVSEPVKLKRQHLGIWVILFLIVFTVLAYLMKKEYWKDVH